MINERYYTVKEALDYIRQYPSGRESTVPYMNISEKQIRDILKKDVLGRYLGLKEGERRVEDYRNFDEEIAYDTMYVFPKYGDNPQILSSWDELYEKKNVEIKKAQRKGLKTEEDNIREQYKKAGKPAYLMNQAYLFSLKLEIERRQLPIVFHDIKKHTKSVLKERISEEMLSVHFDDTALSLLNEFNDMIQEDLREYNELCLQQHFSLRAFIDEVRFRTMLLKDTSSSSIIDQTYIDEFDKFNRFYNSLMMDEVTYDIGMVAQLQKLKENFLKAPTGDTLGL